MKRKTVTAREQPSTANIGNDGKNSRHQPPAELELRKWIRNFCSNRLERKKWNTSEGRPFIPKKFPIELRVQFAIKPVELEILSKLKAPQVYQVSFYFKKLYLFNSLSRSYRN